MHLPKLFPEKEAAGTTTTQIGIGAVGSRKSQDIIVPNGILAVCGPYCIRCIDTNNFWSCYFNVVFYTIFLKTVNMNKTDNISSFIQNCALSLAKHFFTNISNIEVHQDRDNISKVKYSDTQFFTKIIFITSISPCETWETEEKTPLQLQCMKVYTIK